jgi:hypothetical protein
MICARHDVEFGRHSCGNQTPGILDILIDEEIDSTHYDECRRKARQVLDAGRHGAGGDFGRASGYAKDGSPTKHIRLGGPDEFTDMWRDGTSAAGPVVKHGINE